MPLRHWHFRIQDILTSIERIRRYTAGLDRALFRQNDLVVDGVIRNLAIIGEAARHVPDDVVSAHAEIAWADMCDMRNVLMHEYFGISLDIVWDTVMEDLPSLEPQLRELLEDEARRPK